MTLELVDPKRSDYRITVTAEEAYQRIYECLNVSNPVMDEWKIYKYERAPEYRLSFKNRFGEKVEGSVGTNNLKRYFGSRVLKINTDGSVTFRRVITDRKMKN